MAWYALRISPGAHRKVSDAMAERKLEAYAPMETYWHRTQFRKTRQERPLLPGYLFAQVDEAGLSIAAHLPSVICAISFGAGPAVIPPRFIETLRTAESAGRFNYTKDKRAEKARDYRPGQPVKIVAGPLAGHNATILKVLGATNVKLIYRLFGRDGEATIEAAKIEPAEEQKAA
jgi:transcriptional antiterminator RfaH